MIPPPPVCLQCPTCLFPGGVFKRWEHRRRMLGPWRSSLLHVCDLLRGPARGHLLEVRAPAGSTPSPAVGRRMHRGFSDRTLSGCRQRPLPGWGQELVPSPVTPTCPEVGLLRATSRYSPFLRNATPREWGGWRGLLGPEGAACRA